MALLQWCNDTLTAVLMWLYWTGVLAVVLASVVLFVPLLWIGGYLFED